MMGVPARTEAPLNQWDRPLVVVEIDAKPIGRAFLEAVAAALEDGTAVPDPERIDPTGLSIVMELVDATPRVRRPGLVPRTYEYALSWQMEERVLASAGMTVELRDDGDRKETRTVVVDRDGRDASIDRIVAGTSQVAARILAEALLAPRLDRAEIERLDELMEAVAFATNAPQSDQDASITCPTPWDDAEIVPIGADATEGMDVDPEFADLLPQVLAIRIHDDTGSRTCRLTVEPYAIVVSGRDAPGALDVARILRRERNAMNGDVRP